MNITDYLKSRHKTIDASIAAEVLAGNQFKEACERAAKAEITALECAIGSGEVPSPGTTFSVEWFCNLMNDLSRNSTISRRAATTIIMHLMANYEIGIKAVTEGGKA